MRGSCYLEIPVIHSRSTSFPQLFMNSFEEIPYAAIAYLTGECNYGGRVTDAWDRRLIVTLLEDYVNSSIVQDPEHKFTPGLPYGAPKQTEHRLVIRFVEENVPVMPSPEAYGLHPNAGIQMDLTTSETLLDSLLLTYRSAGSARDADAEKKLLSAVGDIANRYQILGDSTPLT